MGGDRVRGDEQLAGDLGVGQAAGKDTQYDELALGQPERRNLLPDREAEQPCPLCEVVDPGQ